MPTSSKFNSPACYSGPVFRVAVPSPLRRTFDYLPPSSGNSEQLQPGVRVLVPFGKRVLVGVLVELATGSDLPASRLKAITAVLDSEPLYASSMQQVLRWAAHYYQCPPGEVYATALPAKLRSGKSRTAIASYWQLVDPDRNNFAKILKRAPRQLQLCDFIAAAKMPSTAQCIAAGFSLPQLRELDRKQVIHKQVIKEARISKAVAAEFDSASVAVPAALTLNDEQARALDSIEPKLDEFACFLLDGVTGSGKTEVYMQAMQMQLAKGKQCLILVPEIGLTPQTLSRFERRFNCPVVALHSGLNDSERLHAWNMAYSGEAGIIIGTRSAIFTPMANPGLIIVDEEHDSSFKQQDGFRYSARDLAVVRAREEKICVILGSATPSLESLHNASANKFVHLRLHKRAGGASPAAIAVVDISNEPLLEGFSELLLYKIERHLLQRGQVLVFLNRRGFAPVLQCQHCGWTAECTNCVALLTVHSKPPGMRCHHCGVVRPLPAFCPDCKSKSLATIGMGTQKVENFLKQRFPDTPVLRIDRDSVRSKTQLEQMLARVHKGEPCILLGTQMLSKGHHFPAITLAAILDADAGLFSPDFRGQEHMAQTIFQVAGRAGRAEQPGEVLIQSRHAGHSALQCLAMGDYSALTNLLLQERRQSGMPPFAHLGLIRAESSDLQQPSSYLRQVLTHAEQLLRKQKSTVTLLGPIPAPMEKRAGRYRWQLLVRSANRTALQNLMSALCQCMEQGKQPAKLRWSVDIDPQDLI